MKTTNNSQQMRSERDPWFSKLCLLAMLVFGVTGLVRGAESVTVVWSEDFEGPTPGWAVEGDTATWETGIPISGPNAAHNGDRLAATVLAGNYTEDRTSRLVSPSLMVPAASENPRLRFWHWWSLGYNDLAEVQISVEGGAWTALSADFTADSSGRWTRPWLDLRSYAGKSVKLGFLLEAHSSPFYGTSVGAGWYLDELSLETGALAPMPNPEGFEGGWGQWYAENGVWEIGKPTSGPMSGHSSTNCAATILDGNYVDDRWARLVSPSYTIPAASDNPRLRFWHCWSFGYDDWTQVQISVDGGAWEALSESYYADSSGRWSRAWLDLSAYAGKKVRFGFWFESHSSPRYGNFVGLGWYVDEVLVETGALVTLPNPEGFEAGWGGWRADYFGGQATDFGIWEIGQPTSGPGSAHSGTQCASTVLAGDYPEDRSSRLVSPPFVIPAASTNPQLRFWHWWSLGFDDLAQVQISVDGGAWEALSGSFTADSSGRWTRAWVDLSAYAGKNVRLGFWLESHSSPRYGTSVGPGWYVDEVSVETSIPAPMPNPEGFEGGWGQWYAENGVWEIGKPTSGPMSGHSSTNCAATILDGNYVDDRWARLVSPSYTIPAASDNPRLRFWHCWSFGYDDWTQVQISVDGGAWEALSESYYADSSGRWSRAWLDLSAYAGKKVRFGFWFESHSSPRYGNFVGLGWYVDEVLVETGALVTLPNPEGFEAGWGGWRADYFGGQATDFGIWEVGQPTSGPGSAYSGVSCAATVLAGNYPEDRSSRFVSPSFVVPAVSENPRLRFWHWWNLGYDDLAQVQISVDGGVWEALSGTYSTDSSGRWSRALLDLSVYAGKAVRLGFWLESHSSPRYGTSVGPGWYVDEVLVESDTIDPIPDQVAMEGSTLAVPISVHGTNLIVQACGDLPAGASIDPETRLFSWTPSETQGPGFYTICVCVMQTGNSLSPLAQTCFNVTVQEANVSPVLDPLPIGASVEVNEGSPVTFKATASDPDNAGGEYVWFLHQQTFTNLTLSPWTAYSRASTKNWEAKKFGDRYYAQILGVGADKASDDWLISPKLDLTGTKAETLSFESLKQYDGPDIQVLVSTNYSGSGDPNVAKWTNLTATLSAGLEQLTASGEVDLSGVSGSSSVYIAFRYTSTGTTSGTAALWQVGNIEVMGTFPALNQKLTFTLDTGAPAGSAIDPSTGAFAWTPGETQGPGVYPISVRVTDDGAPGGSPLSAARSFTVTVKEVNVKPTIASIADMNVNEGVAFGFTATADDPDLPANTLTWTLDDASKALGASIDPTSGVFQWKPSEAQGPGEYPMTLTVADSNPDAVNEKSLSDTKTFKVKVLEMNQAPVLDDTVVSDQTISEGSEIAFVAKATDSDTPTNSISFSLGVGAPSGASIDPTTGQFRWTATEAQGPGVYPITVIATDSNPIAVNEKSLTDSMTFQVTVGEMNLAPSLAFIADQVVDELKQLVVTNRAVDLDLPANALSYTLLSAPSEMTVDSQGVIRWTPSESQGGTTNGVVMKVTDNGVPALSATNTFQVVVNEVNATPTLPSIAQQTINEMTTLTLTNTATDSDIPTNLLTYTLVGAPSGMVIDPHGILTWTPTEAQGPSTNSVGVIVNDNTGTTNATVTNTFTVVVKEVNVAPVMPMVADLTVQEETALVVTNTATDSDLPANVLTYALLTSPSGMVIDAKGLITWTPSESQGPSTNLVVVKVSDDGASPLSATNSFQVVVSEKNEAPVLPLIAAQTVNELAALVVTNRATDKDLPANKLTYTLVSAPAGMVVDANGVITWTPSESQSPSTNLVKMVVTDHGSPSMSATNSFQVTAKEVNQSPVLASIPNQTVNEGALVSFKASATDGDLPVNSLTFRLQAGAPSGATITSDGQFTWTPTHAQAGTHTIGVIVDDNTGTTNATASASFTVTVKSSGPVIAAIADKTVNEETELSFTATATPAEAGNRWALKAPVPEGAKIDAITGKFSWTPSEAQGPGEYTFALTVDDGKGATNSVAQTSFKVSVKEVNKAPELEAIGAQTVEVGTTLNLVAKAKDDDLPANTLVFTLGAGAPTNATITANGSFSWTPSETGEFQIPVIVTDTSTSAVNEQHLADTLTFAVTVYGVFTNLDFEQADVSSARLGKVSAEKALPHWNQNHPQADLIGYDKLSYPSGLLSVSIHDSKSADVAGLIEGKYGVMLEAGSPTTGAAPTNAVISQKGMVPANAKSLRLRTNPDYTLLKVYLNDTEIAMGVTATNGEALVLCGNVESFAGEVAELKIEATVAGNELGYAFIDSIVFAAELCSGQTPPPVMRPLEFVGGNVRITVDQVTIGKTYELQSTEDLGGGWKTVQQVQCTVNPLQFTDTTVAGHALRFYRVIER